MMPLITSPLKNSASRLACVSIAAELVAGGAALVSRASSLTTGAATGDGAATGGGVATGRSAASVPLAWGVWLAAGAGAGAVRAGGGWLVVGCGPMLSPPASRETCRGLPRALATAFSSRGRRL